MSRFDITAKRDAGANETPGVLGPGIRFLTALSDEDDEYGLIAGAVPAGAAAPIHGHPERETFYLLAGEMQGLWEHGISLGASDVLDAPGSLK
jgi:hypothetical protein